MLVGAALVVVGVLWQAFTIAAYVRGAGQGALDAHGGGSLIVHLGELAIVIGAIVRVVGQLEGRRRSLLGSSCCPSRSSPSSATRTSRAAG